MPRQPIDLVARLREAGLHPARRKMLVWGAALTLLLALSLLTGGGGRGGVSDAPQPGVPSLTGLSVRAGGSLLVILSVLLGGAWLARTYGIGAKMNPASRGRLAVEERIGIAGRQSVYVVRYRAHRFLIGSDQSGLKLLSRIPRMAKRSPVADGCEDREA